MSYRWFRFSDGMLRGGTWHTQGYGEFAEFSDAVSFLNNHFPDPASRTDYFVLIKQDDNRIASRIIPPCLPLPANLDDLRCLPESGRSTCYYHDMNLEYYPSWSPPGAPRYFVCHSRGTPADNMHQLSYQGGFATPELILAALHERGAVFPFPCKIVAVLGLPYLFLGNETRVLLNSGRYEKVDITGDLDSLVCDRDPAEWSSLFRPVYHDIINHQPNQESALMPPSAIPPLTHTPDSLVRLAIRRDPSSSRLALIVDAKPLHDLLDRMGVTVEPGSDLYANRPATRTLVASGDFQLSTEVLLRRRYPAEYNLSSVWSTPPTIKQLRTLGESAHAAIRKVLEHYRPIDISFSIIKSAV